MFFKQKPKAFFNAEQSKAITQAIEQAEQKTSGEIRIYIEQRCRFVNAMDRAIELFNTLNIYKTKHRNGVLVYLATQDKQLAVCGDEGIHTRVGDAFWNNAVQKMIQNFSKNNYTEGLINTILQIGETLQQQFPYDKSNDQNELSNDIVYGK